MQRWVPLLAVLCAIAFSSPARAQGLIQLTINGRIDTKGGAYVELEVAGHSRSEGREAREVGLKVHLAEGTTAVELVSFLAQQLALAEIGVNFHGAAGAEAARAQLFVEEAIYVNLRLGHGLWANVTTCHGAPSAVRFMPTLAQKGAAEFGVHVTTRHPHTQARGHESLVFDIEAGANGPQLAERLVTQAIESGWIAERPRKDSWRVVEMGDGSEVTGLSLDFRTPDADWRLELELSE